MAAHCAYDSAVVETGSVSIPVMHISRWLVAPRGPCRPAMSVMVGARITIEFVHHYGNPVMSLPIAMATT